MISSCKLAICSGLDMVNARIGFHYKISIP